MDIYSACHIIIVDHPMKTWLCSNHLVSILDSCKRNPKYPPIWMKRHSIASGCGLSPVRCQAITYSVPSHYLNQCWFIVNSNLGNKLHWNSNHDTKLFIHENAFEIVVCKMAAILAILPRGRWVKNEKSLVWWAQVCGSKSLLICEDNQRQCTFDPPTMVMITRE